MNVGRSVGRSKKILFNTREVVVVEWQKIKLVCDCDFPCLFQTPRELRDFFKFSVGKRESKINDNSDGKIDSSNNHREIKKERDNKVRVVGFLPLRSWKGLLFGTIDIYNTSV